MGCMPASACVSPTWHRAACAKHAMVRRNWDTGRHSSHSSPGMAAQRGVASQGCMLNGVVALQGCGTAGLGSEGWRSSHSSRSDETKGTYNIFWIFFLLGALAAVADWFKSSRKQEQQKQELLTISAATLMKTRP